jgi:transcriptional regulator with XRE-family HTH domain
MSFPSGIVVRHIFVTRRRAWHGYCLLVSWGVYNSPAKERSHQGAHNDWQGKTMKHPVDAHVGKRIRHRRWMVGMTQQQLAERVGIKFQQIQKYETGMNRVSASRLWDIAAVLEVPIAFFFDGLEAADSAANDGAAPEHDLMADKEALSLVRIFHAIPEQQRRRLFDLARVLTDAA